MSLSSGNCVGIEADSKASNTNLILEPCEPTNEFQRWSFQGPSQLDTTWWSGVAEFPVGKPVSFTPLTATNGTSPYTYSATDLPAGLKIDAKTGTVSGTPTQVDDGVATITVTDAANQAQSYELMYWIDAVNLAPSATATASSSYGSAYVPANVTDGIIGKSDTGEWASKGETTPSITLSWTTPQKVSTVTVFDRPNAADWAKAGTLTFSDGSTIPLSGISNDGTARTVSFPERSVTWMKFTVTSGSGSNVGLSEIQVQHR